MVHVKNGSLRVSDNLGIPLVWKRHLHKGTTAQTHQALACHLPLGAGLPKAPSQLGPSHVSPIPPNLLSSRCPLSPVSAMTGYRSLSGASDPRPPGETEALRDRCPA